MQTAVDELFSDIFSPFATLSLTSVKQPQKTFENILRKVDNEYI